MSGNVPNVFPPFPIKDDWQPKARLIWDVSVATRAVVVTTEDHGYLDGMVVRIHVPGDYLMRIQGVETSIVIVTPTSFLTEIDTSYQLPFTSAFLPYRFTPAQVVPVAGPFQNVARNGSLS